MHNMTLRPAFIAAAVGMLIASANIIRARAALPIADATANGVLRVKSLYPFDVTVTRIKADIATKGIKFFDEIDQSRLGAGANIPLQSSKLLLFGNPPLGVQFLTSNRMAGLDWPVRMLVAQDTDGTVWVAWTDLALLGDRYAIHDRAAALKMPAEVSTLIASSVTH